MEIQDSMPQFELPNVKNDKLFDVHNVSGKLLPREKLGYVPVSVTGDGSCLYHSLSYLLTGDEDQIHEELRVRVTVELAINSNVYKSYTATFFDNVTDISEKGIMDTARESSYATPIHIVALSSVINMEIDVAYPEVNFMLRPYMNRLFRGRENTMGSHSLVPLFPLKIMWTRLRTLCNESAKSHAFWEPDHFVPLVHFTQLGMQGPKEFDRKGWDDVRKNVFKIKDENIQTDSASNVKNIEEKHAVRNKQHVKLNKPRNDAKENQVTHGTKLFETLDQLNLDRTKFHSEAPKVLQDGTIFCMKINGWEKLDNHNWRKINFLMTKNIPDITARYRKCGGSYLCNICGLKTHYNSQCCGEWMTFQSCPALLKYFKRKGLEWTILEHKGIHTCDINIENEDCTSTAAAGMFWILNIIFVS